MPTVSFKASIFVLLFYGVQMWAAVPILTTFQSKILLPSGVPLEAANVNFRFTVLDNAGTCVLYVEDFNSISMAGSQGTISLSLGAGAKQYPPVARNLYEVFNNSTGMYTCQAGGTYTPSATDHRQIVMQFNDGNGWQTLPPMSINSVLYANYSNRAENLGDYASTDYLRPATLPTCTGTQALSFDGTAFTCVAASGGGGGGVSSVAGTSPISVAAGTTTPVISIAKASGSASGYLSSADWTMFNSKVNSVVGAGNLYLGNASGDATGVTLSGDATLATSGVMTLANSGVTAGTYGSVNAVPSFTIDAKGRVTNATSSAYQYASAVDKGVVQIGSNITLNSGVISVLSSDITNALGFTPASSSGSFINGGNSFSADATLGATSNFALGFLTNNLNRLTIASSGNIGIGTTTPTAVLQIATAASTSTPELLLSGTWFRNMGNSTTTKPQLLIEQSATTSNAWSSLGTGLGINAPTGFNGNLIDVGINAVSKFRVSYAGVITGDGTAITNVTAHPVGSNKELQYNDGGVTNSTVGSGWDKTNSRLGIGTTTPSETLEVAGNAKVGGQIYSKSQTIVGGTSAIDWNNGNAILTDYDCASSFSFANLRDGGTYTLIVTGTGTVECDFSTTVTGGDAGTVAYRYKPANGVRSASSYTVYTLMRVGSVVLVSWASGF